MKAPRSQLGLVSLWLVVAGCAEAPLDDEEVEGREAPLVAADVEYATIEACVEAHVAAACGDPRAVLRLDCAATTVLCEDAPDLSSLSRLPRLRELDLSGRCVRDVAPIAALTSLRRLELARNAVVSIRPLRTLRGLVYLGLATNPVEADWGYVNREPFESLDALEELVLDGTEIDNILPVSRATHLRVLSMRNMPLLDGIRPIVSLTKLRVLHVDGSTFVSDLDAVADMTRLETLTADDTIVSSIEPLRRLGRLRTISVARACVTACGGFGRVTVDCSDPLPPAVCDYDPMPQPSKLAVPVAHVSRFAPPGLPVWTAAEIAYGFEAARTAPGIEWRQARSNCDGRAHQTAALFESLGLPAFAQVMSFGNLRMLTPYDAAGYLYFDWHTAIVVRGASGIVVIDPALDDRAPLPIDAWFARQVDSRGANVDFACEQYWVPSLYCEGSDSVDARGDFLVDAISSLRGVVYARD